MSQKIKLEVNHQAHAADKSGGKLSSKKQLTNIDTKKQSLATIPQKNIKKDSKDKQKLDKDSKTIVTKIQDQKAKKKPEQKKQLNKQQTKQLNNDKKSMTVIKAPQKKDTELDTINKIKNQQKKAKLTIQQLIQQYKGTSDDIFKNNGHNPQKQKAIASNLQRLQKEKRQRLLKIQIQLEKQKKRKEKQERQQYERQLNKINKIKNKIKKRCEKAIRSVQMRAKSRIQKSVQFQDFYQQYKQKKPLYQVLQDNEKKRQQEEKQKMQLILHQNHQKYSPIPINEIKSFEESYIQKKYERIIEAQNKRQSQLNNLTIQNKFLQKLWKGQFHKITEQESRQEILKRQEGKKSLSSRINYGTNVKLHHQPQTKSSNNPFLQEIREIQESNVQKRVIVEKYKHGVNLGPTVEFRRLSLSVKEKNDVGNSYLQQIKKKPKMEKQTIDRYDQTIQQHSLEMQTKKREKQIDKKGKLQKVERQTNPYYRYSPLSNRTQIQNKDSLVYELTKIDAKKKQIQLEEKSIKYGNYGGILQLQKKKNAINKNIIQNITEKLDLLQKL